MKLGLRAGALALVLAGCLPHRAPATSSSAVLATTPEDAPGRLEVREEAKKPRLTLVTREGDPSPALVVVVATDLGALPTTALAALVEARLTRRGLAPTTRVDRSAFYLGFSMQSADGAEALLEAVAQAFGEEVVPGAPELQVVAERVAALRRHPLDAPELGTVAACTGQLGVGAGQGGKDPTAADLERFRRQNLGSGHTSIAAVGPRAFCSAVSEAFDEVSGWRPSAPVADPVPSEDTLGVYTSPELRDDAMRLTVALRVSDPRSAVAAATRLAAPDRPLVARLGALGLPFRAEQVIGTARPGGGCVAVSARASDLPEGMEPLQAAAEARVVIEQELRTELESPRAEGVATRQIFAAADPIEVGSRAAWWALARIAPAGATRMATVLALAPSREVRSPPLVGERTRALGEAIERALAAPAPKLESAVAVERGQGQVWVLLASECGTADEGERDAGAGALGAIIAASSRADSEGVSVEPWLSPSGIGILAHATFAEGESPTALGERVGRVAARTMLGATPTGETLDAARAMALSQIEKRHGSEGAAIEAFVLAAAPAHPSWLSPIGTWSRVASANLESVRLRWHSLTTGPLRVAVLANTDQAQGDAAVRAASRWLGPRMSASSCAAPALPRLATSPGVYTVKLGGGARGTQAAIGASFAASDGAAAEALAAILGGDRGTINAALRAAALAASASVELLGGARARALLIHLKASPSAIDAATAIARAQLQRLATAGPTEAEVAYADQALASRHREIRVQPQNRLLALWGVPAPSKAPTTIDAKAVAAFAARVLGDASLIVVTAKP